MNLQSKFGYCNITQTLNIALCKRDGITDRQTDDAITTSVDAPGGPFRLGLKKVLHNLHYILCI